MDIDRSRFLFLTASLAAAACNQTPGPASPDTGGAEPAHAKADPASPDTGASASGDDPSVWLEIEPGTEDEERKATGDCDNVSGRPATCTLTAPGSHCESFNETQRMCRAYAEFLQPRAAEAAVDCMLSASGSWDLCNWSIQNDCASAGLQATCVDPATRSDCDAISSSCGGSVDPFTCQQALSAVKPHNITRLSSCIQEFCEVPFCVTDLGRF